MVLTNVTRRLVRSVVAVAATLLCVPPAMIIPTLWEGAREHDTLQMATTLAFLVFLLGLVLRRGFRWDVWDFMWGALASTLVVLLMILQLTHDLPEVLWIMSLFVILPWFFGLGIGSLLRLLPRRGPLPGPKPSDAPNGVPGLPQDNSGVAKGPPWAS